MQISLVVCSLCILLQESAVPVQGWQVFKNDATEIIPEYTENTGDTVDQTNSTMNRPKHGGRNLPGTTQPNGASGLGCKELRSTRYITDGACRSLKPVKELVCSGQCMPSHLVPNSIGRGKWWRHNTSDYRCVPAHFRTQRVQLECPDQESRTYKIQVVTSCKCKRYTRHHNQSELKDIAKDTTKPKKNKKKPRHSRVRSKVSQRESENAY
ncbi:sclerostin [Latimeria chalumnae]|uniref:Sclerostin n=1 Tax=Latimeria chalumnae TaxID=7897 RepID=H3AQC7_LATCH|nr:PREDICTED: sclerostin [Latimeria chalumnae]|eukprot:XP_006000832.1 PREDICTED: sclerostin [Latimeria chalumnae]